MNTNTSKPRRIIRLPELLERTGLSKSTVYDRLDANSPRHDPEFPRPIKLGITKNSAVGWSEEALDTWINKTISAQSTLLITASPPGEYKPTT